MKYKNILIVDDSSTSRMIIQRCMEIAGHAGANYFFAEDGLGGISTLEKENCIDLIITDLIMPRIDGENFIRKIKMMDAVKNIPVLVISSIGEGVLKNKKEELCLLGIINKPLSPAKLVQVLGENHD